ncbi:MAG: hypothetical protein M1834_005106 [Cirrosporium novae-zelandiae]|nr:MAG: hypothetical protein M1834_005106 [Cirrosporium novae-zelandiae]
MVEFIPPPDPRALLSPLLACLATAFASNRPPPALLPLLSPVLRQRVQLLSDASTSESWLPLLSWKGAEGSKLMGIVEHGDFEPHPSSGEFEIEDIGPIRYKRQDEETLKARISVTLQGLVAHYLWCVNDEQGGGNGWRMAELLPLDSTDNDLDSWSSTISEADEKHKDIWMQEALQRAINDAPQHSSLNVSQSHYFTSHHQESNNQEDDDDDYWAMYDRTPGRGPTPAIKKSPDPTSLRGRGTSEADYYAQYASVQPAMDNHDPSEQTEDFGNSSLQSDTVFGQRKFETPPTLSAAPIPPPLQTHSAEILTPSKSEPATALIHPHPRSASSASSSRASEAVSRLEQEAERHSPVDLGIKQHISTSIKSLFRLAKGSGMKRADFEELVNRELEVLNFIDDDD